jgi:DNA gyrase inhibitor GyrI/AraC-like DNA-binding protein
MIATESRQFYARRINRVIDYIREHLAEPLPLERLARLAHFSPFHFHRVFRGCVGEPLHAFIVRLRLEQAVARMAYGPPATLTEIALECGFAASSDFSKAFKQAYGLSPSRYSRERLLEESKIRQDLLANAGYGFGAAPKAGNPDRFRVRLVDRPTTPVALVRVIGGYDAPKILGGFERLMDWGRARGLVPRATLIGMSPDNPDITPMRKYRFDWCLELPPGVVVDGDASPGRIPAGRYACLHCRGDIQKVDRAWHYLFGVWLPNSGHQPTHDPCLEIFRRHPLDVGWETFDIDCCLPVKPLPGGVPRRPSRA